jgi:hypothetical protein
MRSGDQWKQKVGVTGNFRELKGLCAKKQISPRMNTD